MAQQIKQLTTVDGIPLKISLRRAERTKKIKALLLIAPTFLFIVISFLVPIANMFVRSAYIPEVNQLMPKTVASLETWDGTGLPEEPSYAAMVEELKLLDKQKKLGKIALRLNNEKSGMRSLLFTSARKIKKIDTGPFKGKLIEINKRWKDRETWAVIKRFGKSFNLTYYLSSFDMKYNVDGDVIKQPVTQRIYITIWLRTLKVSLLVTIICLFLGFPVSYLLSTLPLKISNLLMICVLLPFWTSLLVRITSWIVLLQKEGVINDILVWLNIVADENRIRMIYNLTGTLVAMSQILLPFIILPLYSVMKTIDPSYVRAARNLGANPFWAFVHVYLPQTLPGIGAGGILVFILALGYYITPALVGGSSGLLIGNFIALHMQKTLNWGLAAAMGAVLLLGVLAIYWLYNRLVGIENMKLG